MTEKKFNKSLYLFLKETFKVLTVTDLDVLFKNID